MPSKLAARFGGWYALPLVYCLLCSALISLTDPAAVMGNLKSTGSPKKVELVIVGESLFNDGVGVVIFSLLLCVLSSGTAPGAGALLLHEAGGGIAFGLVLGFMTYRLLKSIEHYQVDVLLPLAAVASGYALARRLHITGPLALALVDTARPRLQRRAVVHLLRRLLDFGAGPEHRPRGPGHGGRAHGMIGLFAQLKETRWTWN